ncbi:GIY-YIG nuclease family protein [Anaerosolibacter sp.]|uniref:GIY-YIG nuclease family protein n=1 Tax=Anaerosolibacter sp. TaxID=1872527 RepID=UPI0039F0FEDD
MEKYDAAYLKGIYAIYQQWGNNEKLIYIGKTKRSFVARINEHYASWLHDMRGQLRVRFGIPECEIGRYMTKQKLSDIETLLIHWHKPSENTSCIRFYTGRDQLELLNQGRRGSLDPVIRSLDLDYC